MATELLTRPSRGQSLSSSENDPYHKGMTGVYDYPYVLDGTPPPAMPPTAGYPLPGTANSTPPPNPWPKRVGIGAAVIVSITAALVGGFTAGRVSTELSAPAPITVTAAPSPAMFNAADADWCREYTATSNRLTDQRKANGWPRDMAATALPASSWSADELGRNQAFQKYLEANSAATGGLQEKAGNPALKTLVDTEMTAVNTLIDRIKNGTYMPADAAILNTAASASVGLGELCVEVPRG